MAVKEYPLERGGPKRLGLYTRIFGPKLTIYVDGGLVSVIRTQAELRKGKTLFLRDGSRLSVQMQKDRLLVWHDDLPVPGSPGDEGRKLVTAYGALYFIGVVTFLVGLSRLGAANTAN